MKRFFYLSLIAVVLLGGSSCKKEPKSGNNSGNVPGDTIKNPNGVDVPAGAKDGVTFLDGGKSVIFNLYAPKKTSVSVIGEFNNWTANDASKMKNSKDGTRWWVQIDNLDPNKEYAPLNKKSHNALPKLTTADSKYNHKISMYQFIRPFSLIPNSCTQYQFYTDHPFLAIIGQPPEAIS